MMGYNLRAIFVCSSDVDQSVGRAAFHFVELPQGILMRPVLDEDWDERALLPENQNSDTYMQRFPDWLKSWMCSIVKHGPVAYVDISCAGGPCCRDVLCIRDGNVLWERSDEDIAPSYEPRRSPKPWGFYRRLFRFKSKPERVVKINRTVLDDAFDELGVDSGQHFDAFDALGLGRYRETEDWLDQ